MKIEMEWKGNLAIGGTLPSGHPLLMDASESFGGENRGPRPVELLLGALSGCTGIDILSILKRMRLEPASFRMELEGERAEEPPKRFTRIHIHYLFEGDLPEDKVDRAIRLSMEKYCTVAHSLNAEITYDFTLNGKKGNPA
jgi:OsmC-like protein.